MSDEFSPATLAASRNAIAMVTAHHFGDHDQALALYAALPPVEAADTLSMLIILATQGYQLAAEADGITLDEALVTVGLMSAGGS